MTHAGGVRSGPELWGGIECTVNRVGDVYHDQVKRSGHDARIEDLDRFAELGVRALRYPVLWERTAPDGLDRADWSWPDARLARLRELEIRPIVGLVHHGSGPVTTNLLDPGFAEGLAPYARAVAERYPWVTDYTPVNEPLTTARFSALYGHWYPHARDALSFARACLTQVRATVLAMRAVREVNPAARLVQTEDLAKTFSTPLLAYQAEFENERRWTTFDLLCGRLAPGTAMWHFFRRAGVPEDELRWFLDNPCPPDVLGVNYYLTSERFLDDRLERYPPSAHGGNERHAYADVEAVRVRAEGIAGPHQLLGEVWERYGLPVAVTEVHNGCTREEQLRWFVEVWEAACAWREAGADVRAVTAWSLLGAYDWNSLVTRPDGCYEPGVFDVRGPRPRPTALAELVRQLAAGRHPDHPALAEPGWWRKPSRLALGFSVSDHVPRHRPHPRFAGRGVPRTSIPRPVVITGATGTLGRAFARLCEVRGLRYRLVSRREMDIAEPESVAAELAAGRPWAVVNAAGFVRVDDAEGESERCRRENRDGAAVLAEACAARGIRLLGFSSDLVFDGAAGRPYVESDPVSPLNEYGRSKAEMERLVLERLPSALVVRTSAFFGPWDEYNFVTLTLRALAGGRHVSAAHDLVVSPTYVPDLVNASLDLLIDGECGIRHLANAGAVSWAELARRVAELAGYDPALVRARRAGELDLRAARPANTALATERGLVMPPLDHALARYLCECEVGWAEEGVESGSAV